MHVNPFTRPLNPAPGCHPWSRRWSLRWSRRHWGIGPGSRGGGDREWGSRPGASLVDPWLPGCQLNCVTVSRLAIPYVYQISEITKPKLNKKSVFQDKLSERNVIRGLLGASIYDVLKIFGFFGQPPPPFTVTHQLILFLLSAFWRPLSPTHCGRLIWKPLSPHTLRTSYMETPLPWD